MSSTYGSRGPTGQVSGNKIPSGHKAGRMQNFTPEMMQLFQQLFGHVGPDSFLSKIASGDEGAFAELEAPAMRQFSGQLGGLASRFSGMGGTGSRQSSGFDLAGTQAASDFSQDLSSKRQGLQRQAIGDLFGMSNMLLSQKPYENFLSEKKPKFWESIMGPLGAGFGAGAGEAAGSAGMEQFMKYLPMLLGFL